MAFQTLPLHVLISAYACAPNRGSEAGMGWNFVTHLARYCHITVITEAEFRSEIELEVSRSNLGNHLKFHFLDIGEAARRRCWNQGDWRFYWTYRQWSKRASKLAAALVANERIDLLHQLNIIGYREPGYLWELGLPFIWGPIGGHDQMPWRYLTCLGWRSACYNFARNVANAVQMRSSIRVRKAAHRAAALISATSENQAAVFRIHGRQSAVIPETGASDTPVSSPCTAHRAGGVFRVAWCGKLVGRKALPLALHAIAIVARSVPVEMHIIGDGSELDHGRRLADALGCNRVCVWHGHVSHERALALLADSDCMLLTSLQEATSTVVLEALSLGLPVVCHDACGFGALIDASCGIKIPLISPRASIESFAAAIEALARDPNHLGRLSEGALVRARTLSWDEKVRQLVGIYNEAVNQNIANNEDRVIRPARTR